MKHYIEFVEVGPRDGFQNVSAFIPTEVKLEAIDRLAASGIRHMQVTSFVSPKAIPQMRDAAEIARYCAREHGDIALWALAPNFRGAQLAWENGIPNVNYVISVSESHNKANVNKTKDESFAELKKIREEFPGLHVGLDVATAFSCPFEGFTPYRAVREQVERGLALGIDEFAICDTVGSAAPDQVRLYLTALRAEFPDILLNVHIHDTRNMGMANTLAAVECGVTKLQASVGGLGGCPFSPGASGNTASEDIVYMLNSMGYETGVDDQGVLEAALYLKERVEGSFSGHQILIQRQM